MLHIAYRIESFHPSMGFMSLYWAHATFHEQGQVEQHAEGIYLGTSLDWCLQTTAALSGFEDRVLAYEFEHSVIQSGHPEDPCGEIVVSKAKLVKIMTIEEASMLTVDEMPESVMSFA